MIFQKIKTFKNVVYNVENLDLKEISIDKKRGKGSINCRKENPSGPF